MVALFPRLFPRFVFDTESGYASVTAFSLPCRLARDRGDVPHEGFWDVLERAGRLWRSG